MQMVVNIPEELYRQVKDPCIDSSYTATECYNAICRGIPLDRFLETLQIIDKQREDEK